MENGFEGRFSRSCVPIASQDGKREGSKEVVQVIERERKVLVFVEVEKVEVERRGRDGNNKNVGVLGKGNRMKRLSQKRRKIHKKRVADSRGNREGGGIGK